MAENLDSLPANLPVPIDDGAGNLLLGKRLPNIVLGSTSGKSVNIAHSDRRTVFYCYPMTGQPGVKLPENWDLIPGARGCTPQSCSFRDHFQELEALNTSVYGISSQDTIAQIEAQKRLHLPFALLSDANLKLTDALKLPTFTVENKRLLKRLTFIAESGKIIKVFYPVFPPDRNAQDVLDWIKKQASSY